MIMDIDVRTIAMRPVSFGPEGLMLHLDGADTALLYMNNGPITVLAEGWHQRSAIVVPGRMTILELVSDSGEEAGWYFDSDHRFIANTVEELGPVHTETLGQAFKALFAAVWNYVAGLPTQSASDAKAAAGILDTISAWTSRQARSVASCAGLFSYRTVTLQMVAPFAGPEDLALFAESSPPVDAAAVAAAVLQPYKEFQKNFLRHTAVVITCPIEGRPIRSRTSLIINDYCFAYRFVSATQNLVYFLFLSKHTMMPVGIYFPKLGIYAKAPYFVEGDAAQQLQDHVLDMAPPIVGYLGEDKKFAKLANIMREAHLGHHLYNELAGLYRSIKSEDGYKIFRTIIWAQHGAEMYGRTEDILPEVVGSVARPGPSLAEVQREVYRTNSFGMRLTDIYVQDDLARRIARLSVEATRNDPVLQSFRKERARARIVIVLGLRVENRTWTRLREGYAALVDSLGGIDGRAVVLIDGHNRANGTGKDAEFLKSHGEGPVSVAEIEHGIVDYIQSHVTAPNVTVISMVGTTLQQNIAMIEESDFFVAPWGAGLAKYKWISNKPGIVFTSQFNLEGRSDLRIYDTPEVRENAIPCDYFDREFVRDDVDGSTTVNLGTRERSNFDLDQDELIRQVHERIKTFTA